MAAPGTIIGQIQPSVAQGTAITQVTGTSTQIQQIQGTQQGVAIPSPQQVPLPATVPAIKEDGTTETVMEIQHSNGAAEIAKENSADGECNFL